MSAFIVLEGLDGSGKSSLQNLLARVLAARSGAAVECCIDPGTTKIGEALRASLVDGTVDLGRESQLLLFCAARLELARQFIAPALARGAWVISHRYTSSSLVYQLDEFGEESKGENNQKGKNNKKEGNDKEKSAIDWRRALIALPESLAKPDYVFWLDCPPKEARRRALAGRAEQGRAQSKVTSNRFEDRPLSYWERMAARYRSLHADGHMIRIDSARSEQDSLESVISILEAQSTPTELPVTLGSS